MSSVRDDEDSLPDVSWESERQRKRLERLARAIARCEHDAEDLVQQTYLIALSKEQPAVRSWGKWLEGVLRNVALHHFRSRRRLRRREREAAASDLDLRAAEVASERPMIQEVLEHLNRLEEPYVTPMRMCYVDGLAPVEIAAKLNQPEGTIHTHLSRGRNRLRDSLGVDGLTDSGRDVSARRKRDERRTRSEMWFPFLGLTGFGKLRARSWSWGGWLAVSSLVAVSLWGALLALGSANDSGARLAQSSVIDGVSRPIPRNQQWTALSSHPTPLEVPSTQLSSATAEASIRTVVGRVVTHEGESVAGLRVWRERGHVGTSMERPSFFAPDPSWELEEDGCVHVATTENDGTFEVSVPHGWEGRLIARDDRWAPVTFSRLEAQSTTTTVELIVAPALAFTGVVRDEANGAPVADALVTVGPSMRDRETWQRPGSDRFFEWAVAKTDSQGAYLVTDVPSLSALRLTTRATWGSEFTKLIDPNQPDCGVVILPSEEQSWIRGRVRAADGMLLREGAVVMSEGTWARLDSWGWFSLAVPRKEQAGAYDVRVVAPGWLPEVLSLEARSVTSEAWSDVMLKRPAKSIHGRVLDAAGQGVHGCSVWVADRTVLELGPEVRVFAERLVRGEVSDDLMRVRTDYQGRFAIEGLVERDYRVVAMDEGTLAAVWSRPWPAGSNDVELELGAEELLSVVSTTVDRHGEPFPEVEILAQRVGLAVPFPPGPAYMKMVDGPSVRSQHDGAFQLPPLAPAGLSLRLSGPEVFTIEVGIPMSEEGELGQVVVPRAVRASITVGDEWDGATHVKIFASSSGGVLPLYSGDEPSAARTRRGRLAVKAGTSRTALLPDTAAFAVLFHGDEELETVSLDLDHEQLETVIF